MPDSIVSLPDGRALAYAEYGDPSGFPILWCHGNPGSRLEGGLLEPAVLAGAKVRVLIPDRPGIGGSTWLDGRAVADWPADVAALTASAGIDEFAVVSLSAGSPFALALAHAVPDRITRVAVISGIGPLDVLGDSDLRESGPRYFAAARRSPAMAGGIVWLMQRGIAKPDAFVARMLGGLPDGDRDVLTEPRRRRVLENLLAEGLRQRRGTAWDATLVARPWGIPLERIAVPVDVWHGTEDRNAPLAMGEWIAEQVPRAQLHAIPGEGHFSLAVRHFGDILDRLRQPRPTTAGR